jgi:hypothetical protein
VVEQLSGKPIELGLGPPEGQGSWRLVDAAVSRQAGACPGEAGLQSFHTDLEPSRA